MDYKFSLNLSKIDDSSFSDFSIIRKITKEIIAQLNIIAKSDERCQNHNINFTILREAKLKFIEKVILLKNKNIIIKEKTGLSYIEFLINNLNNLYQIFCDQLNFFNLCIDQRNPMLYFNSDNDSNFHEIIQYADADLKSNTFKEIEINYLVENRIN